MRFVNASRKRKLTINITPLIDVLFLLVIFVLVTAQFEDSGGITVDLPQGSSKELPEHQTVNLVLTVKGNYFLNGKKIKMTKLKEVLQQESTKAKQTVLIVKADRLVPWEKIVTAIDTAKGAGLRQVAFKIRQ